MRFISLKIFAVLLLVLSLVACSQDEYDIRVHGQILEDRKVSEMDAFAAKYPEAHYYELVAAADSIVCYAGKSVAVFGGSLAANSECDVCKSMYTQLLHCSSVVTYAHGGYGYATTNGSVQDYLPILGRHDIYILWCSTNDYSTSVPVGSPTDFTEADGYDEEHTNTQCGGINRCIRTIREMNSDALIVGFTSLRFFGEDGARKEGYLEDSNVKNKQGSTFKEYVDTQRETFKLAGIPYFDQYYCGLFDVDNYASFYFTDGYHLNEDGYFLLGCKQIWYFIDLAKEHQW